MLPQEFQWEGFQANELIISWKVVKLTLRRTFTTAHSSSDTRNNFFFRISSEASKGKGFGQCGLPPKKKLCYLADINDCRTFANQLRSKFQLKNTEVTNLQLDSFKEKLFQDIPREYFKYFYQENLDNIQTQKLMRSIILVLYWGYEIKQPRFKAAISGLEYALFDFYAKYLNKSLTSLIFPSKQQSSYEAYSFYTLSYEQDANRMIENALEFLKFTSYIKIKYIDNISSLLALMIQLEKASHNQIKGYIIDANASWKADSFKIFNNQIITEKYDSIRNKIMYIQQPFPIQMDENELEQWKKLKSQSNLKVMIDQSFSSYEQVQTTLGLGHAVNIKSEKAGGPINCLRAALYARKYGLQLMLGCMVSTHLGCNQTYCLYPLTKWLDVDGSLLVQTPDLEGGFQWGGSSQLLQPKVKYFGLEIDTSLIQ